MYKNKRIEEIHQLLVELASGNFGARGKFSKNYDDFDAIIFGINTLSEELLTSTYSRDYLNSIFKGIVDMTIVLGSNDTIQKINDPVCKLLLYKKEELIGQDFAFLLDKELQSFRDIENQFNADGYCYDQESYFIKKDGSKLPVSFSGSLLYDKKNMTHGKLFIAKDVSKIKKTEKQLKQKNAELNNFIYKASHDLKGPLASTLGLVNLAKDENDVRVLKQYIGLIEKSTQRLDAILMGLTEITRVSESAIENSIIDFKPLIDDLLESLEYLPECKDMSFKVNTVQQTKEFRTDSAILKSILKNLIENGIKYKKGVNSDSFLSIKISDMKKGVEIEVSDNGIGIPENIQSEIFKMFFRGTMNPLGSGLGLYVVKTCIERLKGKISVKSIPNQGSVFSVYLPGALLAQNKSYL